MKGKITPIWKGMTARRLEAFIKVLEIGTMFKERREHFIEEHGSTTMEGQDNLHGRRGLLL